MKSTNRIHRNGGTKPASVQTKISRRKSPAALQRKIDAAEKRSAAAVLNLANVYRQVKTPPAQDEPQAVPTAGRIIEELRMAKAQSAALHMLLLDVLSVKPDIGTYGEEIELGITELVIGTHGRMDNAVESVETLITNKSGVAS